MITSHASLPPAGPDPVVLPAQPGLGALLRAYRSEQHLTVNAFADRADIARSQLCAMLNGTATPGPKVAGRLARLLTADPPAEALIAEHAAVPDRAGPADTPLRRLVTARLAELDLNMTSLARAAGVGRTALFSWLAGDTAPSPRHRTALAAALGVPVAEIAAATGSAAHQPATVTEGLRLSRGWTLAALAERAGVAVTALRRLERAEPVRPRTVAAVAAVLDVRPGELCAAPAPAGTGGRSRFAELVAAVLTDRAWTAADLAAHLGVHRQQLSAWRSGVDPVPGAYVPPLAELFGLDPDELGRLLQAEWENRPARAAAARRGAARRASGLRQRDVAQAAGIAHTTFTRWECGRGYLHERHLAQVAQVLDVPVENLR